MSIQVYGFFKPLVTLHSAMLNNFLIQCSQRCPCSLGVGAPWRHFWLSPWQMKVKEESENVGLKLNIQKLRWWHLVPSVHGKWMGKQWKQWETLFWGVPKSLQMVTAAMKLRHLLLGRKVMTNLDSIIKKQRHYFANKGPSSQSFGSSSGHVWMWELDYKESRAQKNWCFWTVVLEKTLESPLDCKEIQPVHPKGNQS